LQQAKQNYQLQLYITVLSVVLFIVKIIAYYLTNSLAVLSDALESIVNVVAGFIGLYALYVAAKPKDIEHPYGHGKAEFVSAAVEGTLIIASGVLILYETIQSIFNNKSVEALDIGLLLVASTAIINFIAGSICLRIGRKNNSLALISSGKHLQIDTYSTLGIIAGLLLIYFTKLLWLDKIIAALVSLLILFNGYKILRASLAGIMDEADMDLLKKLVRVLNENRKINWIDLHNLRIIKYGSTLHLDAHLTVPWYLNVNEAHFEIDDLKNIITNEFGDALELFVHTDGCIKTSCPICTKADCQVRQHDFEKKMAWTLDNILSNQKHNINSIKNY
jgi:cation diffusion facilitator family transporter